MRLENLKNAKKEKLELEHYKKNDTIKEYGVNETVKQQARLVMRICFKCGCRNDVGASRCRKCRNPYLRLRIEISA